MPIDSDEDTTFGDLAEANERKDAYLGVLRAGELETADALRAWSSRKKTLEKDKPVNAWDEDVEQGHQDALRTLREPATLREAPTRRISTVVDARPSRISSRPPLSKEDVQTFFGKDAWENTPENVIYFLLHVSCLIAFVNPQEYGQKSEDDDDGLHQIKISTTKKRKHVVRSDSDDDDDDDGKEEKRKETEQRDEQLKREAATWKSRFSTVEAPSEVRRTLIKMLSPTQPRQKPLFAVAAACRFFNIGEENGMKKNGVSAEMILEDSTAANVEELAAYKQLQEQPKRDKEEKQEQKGQQEKVKKQRAKEEKERQYIMAYGKCFIFKGTSNAGSGKEMQLRDGLLSRTVAAAVGKPATIQGTS